MKMFSRQSPALQPAATPPTSTKGSSALTYVSIRVCVCVCEARWAGFALELTAGCVFAGKVLGNLQLNLLSKSKVYEDAALSAIFLHNNYNYILKSLEK